MHAQHILKNALLVSESDDMSTDALAQSGLELLPIKTSKTTIVASARDCIVQVSCISWHSMTLLASIVDTLVL